MELYEKGNNKTKGGIFMNATYDYYYLTHNYDTYPSWIQSERYFNCDSFSKLFSFLWNR